MVMNNYFAKTIKVFKEVSEGAYDYTLKGYKIIGTEEAIKAMKTDLIAMGMNESDFQLMFANGKTKSPWFLQLQGTLKGEGLQTNYNVNLYPDPNKETDMLTFQLSKLAEQLELEDTDIISVLNTAISNTVKLYVYTNAVMKDGVVQQYKNNSFSKPVQANADADFE